MYRPVPAPHSTTLEPGATPSNKGASATHLSTSDPRRSASAFSSKYRAVSSAVGIARVERLAVEARAPQPSPGVEHETGVLGDLVVGKLGVVDAEDHQIRRRDLLGRAVDAA